MEEARDFEAHITPSSNLTYSHRDGQHDDLLLATAIALWWADRHAGPPIDGTFADFGQARTRRADGGAEPTPFPR